ncbi:hypothetical protein BgAZ_403620 [Babesia gibsoni]|uniref:Uncharacterized protein n=1 Tax=Babesia gibsoni TaxID=33632 RepID=A0AAD8LQ57_BABGI|nr:hypothetical protein BgAZ_403620 [Babesia gibsoni]
MRHIHAGASVSESEQPRDETQLPPLTRTPTETQNCPKQANETSLWFGLGFGVHCLGRVASLFLVGRISTWNVIGQYGWRLNYVFAGYVWLLLSVPVHCLMKKTGTGTQTGGGGADSVPETVQTDGSGSPVVSITETATVTSTTTTTITRIGVGTTGAIGAVGGTTSAAPSGGEVGVVQALPVVKSHLLLPLNHRLLLHQRIVKSKKGLHGLKT